MVGGGRVGVQSHFQLGLDKVLSWGFDNKEFLKAALPIRVSSSSLCFFNQEVTRNEYR